MPPRTAPDAPRLATRKSNKDAHPGLVVAPKPRKRTSDVQAEKAAKLKAKKVAAKLRKEKVERLARIEDQLAAEESVTVSTPKGKYQVVQPVPRSTKRQTTSRSQSVDEDPSGEDDIQPEDEDTHGANKESIQAVDEDQSMESDDDERDGDRDVLTTQEEVYSDGPLDSESSTDGEPVVVPGKRKLKNKARAQVDAVRQAGVGSKSPGALAEKRSTASAPPHKKARPIGGLNSTWKPPTAKTHHQVQPTTESEPEPEPDIFDEGDDASQYQDGSTMSVRIEPTAQSSRSRQPLPQPRATAPAPTPDRRLPPIMDNGNGSEDERGSSPVLVDNEMPTQPSRSHQRSQALALPPIPIPARKMPLTKNNRHGSDAEMREDNQELATRTPRPSHPARVQRTASSHGLGLPTPTRQNLGPKSRRSAAEPKVKRGRKVRWTTEHLDEAVRPSFNSVFMSKVRGLTGMLEPWSDPSAEEVQVIFDEVYPGVKLTIVKGEVVFDLTMQRIKEWRSMLASEAMSVTKTYLDADKHGEDEDEDDDEVRASFVSSAEYVKWALASEDGKNAPMYWARWNSGAGREGRFQFHLIMKTLAAHLACITSSTGDRPSGALILSLLAVERALKFSWTGEPVIPRGPAGYFSGENWGDKVVRVGNGQKKLVRRSGKFLGAVAALSDNDWERILGAATACRSKVADSEDETMEASDTDHDFMLESD
ncbi:hypothetical protein OF83DRAFT_1088985 [Amylostereum chailletii]|nr:hypothetical protein OF83DRAFT_1088985 [Amylostereum chailletii]